MVVDGSGFAAEAEVADRDVEERGQGGQGAELGVVLAAGAQLPDGGGGDVLAGGSGDGGGDFDVVLGGRDGLGPGVADQSFDLVGEGR